MTPAGKADPRGEAATAVQDLIRRLKANDPASVVENYDIHVVRGEDLPPGFKDDLVQVIRDQSANFLDVLEFISSQTPADSISAVGKEGLEVATYNITDPVNGKATTFHLLKLNGVWCDDENDVWSWQSEILHPELTR